MLIYQRTIQWCPFCEMWQIDYTNDQYGEYYHQIEQELYAHIKECEKAC